MGCLEVVGGVDLRTVSPDTVYKIGDYSLPGLVKFGAVWLDVGEIGQQVLTDLHVASVDFFRQSEEIKAQFSGPGEKPTVGRRPFKISNASNKPEHFESFVYWGEDHEVSDVKRVPNGNRIRPVMDGLRGFRRMSGIIVAQAIEQMQEHYDPEHKNYSPENPLRFHAGTLDQVNFMDAWRIGQGLNVGELSSEEHEDADFLTVIWASQPGLEGRIDGEYREIAFPRNHVVLMAGSIATEMTGGFLPDGTPAAGAVPPLFHRVRYLGSYESDITAPLMRFDGREDFDDTDVRVSEMEFVSPDAGRPIEAFIKTEWNQDIDLQALVIGNPQKAFGIGEDFVTGLSALEA
jgi:hypothetical protein